MAYWRPVEGAGFVPGVEMKNYSDRAMRELEEEYPGLRESGAFEHVNEPMPDEPAPAEPAPPEEAPSEEPQ